MSDSAKEIFDAALSRIPSELQTGVEAHWLDFHEHLPKFTSASFDKWQIVLPRVFALSEFAALVCKQHPQALSGLIESGDLFRAYDQGELLRRIDRDLAAVSGEPELKVLLRQLRRRELLRIAWRDLAGWADLDEVLASMSEFAEACIDTSLRHLYRWAVERKGKPLGGDGKPAEMVVLGMGKLGGSELNFSSDIDLIFAYDQDGETQGPGALSNHEFFTQLGRALIDALSDSTEDGLVFRVDMRLRPNGTSGPLALSFDAMEQYYQNHGRAWERYAFIKARVVGGPKAAGEELLEALKPFVYRRYLDFGAVEEIRELKSTIDQEVRRKRLARNIKLGPGGIREIEFIGQSFQLIRGGREPRLQDRRIQSVLGTLASENYLAAEAAADLQAAYEFLRNTEHRLQMAHDRQTHLLPEEELEQVRLAFSMGFADWSEFNNRLRQHCERVHALYDQTFNTQPREPAENASRGLEQIWLGSLEDAKAETKLAAVGFGDTAGTRNALQGLRNGPAFSTLSKEGRERLDRLMPLLIAASAASASPDVTLVRCIKLIESIGRRAAYLALLVENPIAMAQLVNLCGASGWITDWLSQHPVLLDELIDPKTLYTPLAKEALQEELQHRLADLPAGDLEAHMEQLREFHHGNLLRVAAAHLARESPSGGVTSPGCDSPATGNELEPKAVSGYLSDLAEVVLESALSHAEGALSARHGQPTCRRDGKKIAAGFCIIAYGRLGSRELSYGSDLDMIFMHEACGSASASAPDQKAIPGDGHTSGKYSIPNELYFARLGQRLIHLLTTRTATGILYPVDMRLRPSGRSGPLVTNLEAFRNYQLSKAWLWEHQALVRARPVAGSPVLAEAFEEIRRQVLCLEREPKNVRAEVAAMRARMLDARSAVAPGMFDLKHGRGGMIDIEFMVQYWVLCWAHAHPVLASKTDNISILNALGQAGLLENGRMRLLTDAYRRYLSAEQRLKLMERASLVPAEEAGDFPEKVAVLWRELFDEEKT